MTTRPKESQRAIESQAVQWIVPPGRRAFVRRSRGIRILVCR